MGRITVSNTRGIAPSSTSRSFLRGLHATSSRNADDSLAAGCGGMLKASSSCSTASLGRSVSRCASFLTKESLKQRKDATERTAPDEAFDVAINDACESVVTSLRAGLRIAPQHLAPVGSRGSHALTGGLTPSRQNTGGKRRRSTAANAIPSSTETVFDVLNANSTPSGNKRQNAEASHQPPPATFSSTAHHDTSTSGSIQAPSLPAQEPAVRGKAKVPQSPYRQPTQNPPQSIESTGSRANHHQNPTTVVGGPHPTQELTRQASTSSVASVASVSEMMSRVLECSICRDTLKDPVSLPRCAHTFCKVCINSWLKRTKPKKKAPASSSLPDAACPLCKQKVWKNDELIVNCTLREISEIVRRESGDMAEGAFSTSLDAGACDDDSPPRTSPRQRRGVRRVIDDDEEDIVGGEDRAEEADTEAGATGSGQRQAQQSSGRRSAASQPQRGRQSGSRRRH